MHPDGARATRTRTVGVETPGDARELLATLGVTNIQFHTYYRRGALRSLPAPAPAGAPT